MEIGGSKITLSQRTTPVRATDNDFSSLSSLSSSSSPSLPLRSQSSSLSSLSTLSVLSSLSSLSSSLSPSPSNLNTPNSNTPKSRETAEIEEQKATIEEKPSNLVALYLSKLQTAFHLRDMEKTKDLCEKLVTLCTDEKNMFKNSSALASSGGLGILCEILNSQSDPIRFEIVRPICFLFSTISHKSKFNRSLARVGAPRPLLHLFKLLLSSLSLSSSSSSSSSSASSSVSSLHPPRSSSRASVSSPRLNRNTNSPTPSLSNSPPQDRIQKQQNKEIEKKEVDNESSPTELDTEKEKDKDKEKEKEKENRKEIVGKERELLHHVLSTLVHLSQIDTTKLPLVMRLEGGLIPLINLLKAGIDESCTSLSLSLSPEFSPVLSLALQFLGAVVDKNGNNCTAVVKEGGVTTILGYLQKMDCYLQITEPAVVVLNRVSEKEKSILGSSGMEIVVSAARRYVTNLPVVLPILGMIYNVIAELENFVSVADLKKDDIFALCEISEKNPHELKVANIVCSILGKIIKLKQQQQTQPSQEVLDIPEDGLNVSIPHSTSPPPSSSSSSSFSNSSISSSSSSSSASSSSSSSLPPLPSATPTQSTLFPEFLPNPSFSPLPPSVFVVRTAAKKILAESPVHLPIFPPPADSSLSPSPSEFIPISTTSSSSFSSISSPHLTSSSASSNSFSLNSSSSTSSPSLLTPSYSPPNVELFHESRSNLAIDMMMRALRIKNDFKPVEVYNSTESVNSRTVQFESRFESGNLQKAFQIGEYEYNLTTSPDVNTQKHTQWFYFRVSNLIPRIDYKFNIVNMEKPTSEFNKGMRPLMYSDKDAKTSGIGWVRCGRDICYYPNQFVRKSDPSCTYYTLTFTVQFPHAGDTCYFAVNYPYTVAMWKSHLAYLVDGRFNDRLLYSTLCRTLAGNACDLLTITSLPYDLSLGKRKYVIFSARVHPGESGCSCILNI